VVIGARQAYTFDEYVELDAMSSVKHEYFGGSAWAMAGGSPEHAAIAASVTASLGAQLRGRPCRVYSSDLRLRVHETGLATYPDVSVVRGKLELDPEDRRAQTIMNPRVVVEVLSPSTEAYDRGEKLAHYKRVESLQEIVLVSHDLRQIEIWRRDAAGWSHDLARAGGVARLESIECTLVVDELFLDPLPG